MSMAMSLDLCKTLCWDKCAALGACETFLETDLWALAHWLMLDGNTLSIAATQDEAITYCLALSLPNSIGTALLALFTFAILPAFHLYHT